MIKINNRYSISFKRGYFTTHESKYNVKKIFKRHYATESAVMIALCGVGSVMQCVLDATSAAIKENQLN